MEEMRKGWMRKRSVCLVNVCDVLFTQGDAICAIFTESVWMKNMIFNQQNCSSHKNLHWLIGICVQHFSPRVRVSWINPAYSKSSPCIEQWVKAATEWRLFGDIKLNSLSGVFFCSGLHGDGDGEGDGERRQIWESWFFSMWTPLQISWNVLGGLAFPVSSAVFPAFPLLSLEELMLTSCSWEPLLPWLP